MSTFERILRGCKAAKKYIVGWKCRLYMKLEDDHQHWRAMDDAELEEVLPSGGVYQTNGLGTPYKKLVLLTPFRNPPIHPTATMSYFQLAMLAHAWKHKAYRLAKENNEKRAQLHVFMVAFARLYEAGVWLFCAAFMEGLVFNLMYPWMVKRGCRLTQDQRMMLASMLRVRETRVLHLERDYRRRNPEFSVNRRYSRFDSIDLYPAMDCATASADLLFPTTDVAELEDKSLWDLSRSHMAGLACCGKEAAPSTRPDEEDGR